MENVKKHLSLLGLKVQDKVTGAKGIVDTVSFDLYGVCKLLLTLDLIRKGTRKKIGGMMFRGLKLKIKNL